MRNLLYLLNFLAIYVIGCTTASTSESETLPVVGRSTLPVTRVVMYRNGIAYVERSGSIDSDIFTLTVKPSQIVDVLKSLTVLETTGRGHVVNVSMPSDRSRLKALESIPGKISSVNGLIPLISAFRGAKARISGDGESLTGRIVGVENMGTKDKPRWTVTVLTSGGSVISRTLDTVSGIKLLDRSLSIAFDRALELSAVRGNWRPVNITVRLQGPRPHRVLVGYVVDAPVWKPSYRIVVGKDGRLLLQGWAVVENLSGTDWKGVRLVLTSGTPVSFRYNLYRPRFVSRPDLTPPEIVMGERPPVLPEAEATAEDFMKSERAPLGDGSFGGRRRARKSRGRTMEYAPPAPAMKKASENERSYFDSARRSVNVMARHRASGPLYFFELNSPVTIPDKSTSMVAVLSSTLKGSEILYYSMGQSDPHPYRALKFENTTGVPLEAGPLEVYRDASFQGEALISGVAMGSMALIPYAGESGVNVSIHSSDRAAVERIVKIQSGVAVAEVRKVKSFKIRVQTNGVKDRVLYVKLPMIPGMKIDSAANVVEEGDHVYVPVKLTERKIVASIDFHSSIRRTYSLVGHRWERPVYVIKMLVKARNLPPKARKSLERVLTLWTRMDSLQKDLNLVSSKISSVKDELREYRNTLKSLGKNGSRKLRRDLESRISKLTSEMTSLMDKKIRMQTQIRDLLREVDTTLRGVSFSAK